jgi:hypothetical protein
VLETDGRYWLGIGMGGERDFLLLSADRPGAGREPGGAPVRYGLASISWNLGYGVFSPGSKCNRHRLGTARRFMERKRNGKRNCKTPQEAPRKGDFSLTPNKRPWL